MKRISLICVLICLLSSTFAQIGFGVKTGVSMNSIALKDHSLDQSNLKTPLEAGYFLGGFITTTLSKRMTLATELLHTSMNVRSKNSYYNNSTLIKENSLYKIQYIQLPLILNFSFLNLENRINPYILTGTSLGYLTSFAGKYSSWETNVQGEQYWSYAFAVTGSDWNNFSRISMNAIGGIGARVKVGSGHLAIELRYNYNFTDILKNSNGSMTTRSSSLGVGYSVPIN